VKKKYSRSGAPDPDVSPVSLDDAFSDGEPEPSALTPSPGCLPKSVKDTGQVLRRNATARIRNPEDDLVISRCRARRDSTANLREFDRVANEVLEHLKEPVPITPDLGNIGSTSTRSSREAEVFNSAKWFSMTCARANVRQLSVTRKTSSSAPLSVRTARWLL